jgi:hypothetical protein
MITGTVKITDRATDLFRPYDLEKSTKKLVQTVKSMGRCVKYKEYVYFPKPLTAGIDKTFDKRLSDKTEITTTAAPIDM